MIKRREFITLLGGAAAWPLIARAQQPDRMRRIGVLLPATADDPQRQAWFGAFLQGLAQSDWIIGRNVQIDTRWATANVDAVRRHATELAALAPDVILASGASTVGPLLQATRTVPIVFAAVADPVGRLRKQLGAAGRQHHRLHGLRIQYQREMAGTAKADRAQRHASGGASGSQHYLWDRPVRRHPGHGAIAHG